MERRLLARPGGVVATIRRSHTVLPPEGWLFLGFRKTLWTLSEAFTSVRPGEAYAYRPFDLRAVGAPPRTAPTRRGASSEQSPPGTAQGRGRHADH